MRQRLNDCGFMDIWLRQEACNVDRPTYSHMFMVSPGCDSHWESYVEMQGWIEEVRGESRQV